MNGARFGDAEALVDGDLSLTYAQLEQEMLRSCRAAVALGVEPGDRVAIWAPNIGEWVVAALGLLGAGAVLVPINTRFKGSEAAFVIERSGATAIFTVNGFLGLDFVDMLHAAAPRSPALERCVVMRGNVPVGALDNASYLESAGSVPEEVARDRIAAISPETIADIMFTSGTTGAPKGVMLTHGQSLRAFDAYNIGFGLRQGDRYLVIPPFFHCFGYKAGWMLCFMEGATVFPLAVFNARDVVERIERDRITILAGAPTMITGVLDLLQSEDHDVTSLRYAFVSAASVPYELVMRMRAELPIDAVGTGYGLTEATAMVSVTDHDDGPEVVARCSGRPIPGVEVKTVDSDGNETQPGQAGEILVRGFNVMKGYYQEPAATHEAIDIDGWLHTGDIGTLDDDGYLKITDRLKDMFIVGGFNAYPAEIENILLRDDRIAQVAVIGVPDERLGEVGAAYVIPHPGVALTPDEVVAWARENMANFKVPRSVQIVDVLPVNATGKVLKHELRAQWLSRVSGSDVGRSRP